VGGTLFSLKRIGLKRGKTIGTKYSPKAGTRAVAMLIKKNIQPPLLDFPPPMKT
jgi:hypothetical protein